MIGLAGAHRTGKTTLARAFANETAVQFVETRTSAVFEEMGLDPKKDYPFDVRLDIQNKILKSAESLYKKANTNFITDRTPLDMLAYTMADVQRDNMTESDVREFEKYMERCYEVTNKYFASIIVVYPGIPMVDEPGKAPANTAYVEHIAMLVMGLAVDERLKAGRHYISRSNLNLDDRIRSIKTAMRNVHKNHMNNIADNEHFH